IDIPSMVNSTLKFYFIYLNKKSIWCKTKRKCFILKDMLRLHLMDNLIGGSVMNIIPYLFVLCAAMLWGTVGTTQTYLEEGISPIAVAGVRSAIGGGVLLITVLMMRKIRF